MSVTQKPTILVILDILTLLIVPAVLILIWFFTPVEAVMGPVQKVFYFHVSAAWGGMLSFILGAVAGEATCAQGVCGGTVCPWQRLKSAWCLP
jgi:hypothetical protein